MAQLNRRQFVSAAAAVGGLTSFESAPRARPASPADEIRVACVGVRGRGNNHIQAFQALPGVEVVALVDVDAKVLGQRKTELEALREGRGVDVYTDIRRVLEREDIHAVALATPNHVHALHAIWACQAGKHVYVEKPISHNVFEGRQLVRAAAKYGTVVQAGMQSRSSHAIHRAIAWMRVGNLGQVQVARGACFKPRQSIGKVEGPQPVPEHVDWDLYCGPAPLEPLRRRSLHYDWHWQFATGNGDLGNQGIHQVDLCRWAIGATGLCRGVTAFGGRFGYDDDGDTPNTMATLFEYDEAPILFEVRGLPRDHAAQSEDWNGRMDQYMGASIGTTIHCEGGSLFLPTNYGRAIAYDADGAEIRRWEGTDDHFANFIEAVRFEAPNKLNAPILEGHVSSALCHIANNAYQRSERMAPDEIRAELESVDLAHGAFERMATHLEANGVDAARDLVAFAPRLAFDPVAECFAEGDPANAFLTRDYRAPFVVPKEV